MQPIPHVVLGFLIGYYIEPLWLIILLAILSHYVLDAIPHWDPAYDVKNLGVNLRNWNKQSKQVKRQITFLGGSQLFVVLSFLALL